MNRRTMLYLIAANVLALIALTFIYPEFMVSPGPLGKGHTTLQADCFACHQPFRGATELRCQSCHALADIGIRDSTGRPIAAKGIKASFHKSLLSTDCMSCHVGHHGAKTSASETKPFSHDLLALDVRSQCTACHSKPVDRLHQTLTGNCNGCHNSKAWKPAQFSHERLTKAALSQCTTCHRKPNDTLHRQFEGSCANCHSTKAWEPVKFNHDRYFVLDRNHRTDCVTCHTASKDPKTGNGFERYTCYGCHAHTLANIRAEHAEEGIRNISDCVRCHRSAGEGEGRDDD